MKHFPLLCKSFLREAFHLFRTEELFFYIIVRSKQYMSKRESRYGQLKRIEKFLVASELCIVEYLNQGEGGKTTIPKNDGN